MKAKQQNWEWQVSRIACRNIAQSVLALDVSDVKITDKLQARVENMLLDEKYKTRKRKLRRRIVAVLVAAAILALTACMAIPKVRKKLYKIVITHCGEFFSYKSELIETDEAAQALADFADVSKGTNSFEKRVPTYIPEGYELYLDDSIYKFTRIYYRNRDTGKVIYYEQSFAGDIIHDINLIDVKVDSIVVNGNTGISAIKITNDYQYVTIIWTDGVYDYSISTTLTYGVTFKIATSIS